MSTPQNSLKTMRETLGLSLLDAAAVLGRDEDWLAKVESCAVAISNKTIANISGSLARWVAAGRPTAQRRPHPKRTRTWTTRPCERAGCLDQTHQWVDGAQDGLCVCSIVVFEAAGREPDVVTGSFDPATGLWEAYTEPNTTELLGLGGLEYLERITAAFTQVQTVCNELNKRSSDDES